MFTTVVYSEKGEMSTLGEKMVTFFLDYLEKCERGKKSSVCVFCN